MNAIAFFDTKPYDRESFDRVNADFNFTIKYFKGHLSVDTAQLAKGYDAVCVFVNDIVNEAVITMLAENGVKLIALRCAGYNNVALKAAYNTIHVVRVPAYSPYAVAEHAVALILALNRKTHRAYYRTRDSNFAISGLLGFDMHGKTAGIIGTGKIGKIVIQILKGFGMRVLAYDRYPNQKVAKELDYSYVDLEELYAASDVISLHCPLSKETEYLVNEKSISVMKPDVMLVNTGRGKLIDTRALIEGLKSGKVGSAGLDVYEEESEYFFEDHSASVINDDVLARLLTFPNVLVTSHQGFFTREALTNIAETTLLNINDFIEGKSLCNEVCYRCDANPCRKTTEGKCF